MADIHLIYTSLAVGFPTRKNLEELLEQSRQRNLRQNITGMLLYRDGVYLQVLEGAKKDVREIFAAIQKDPRNRKVTKLLEEEIIKRDFPDWTMGFRNLQGDVDNAAYSDIFNGNFDQSVLYRSRSLAVNLILGFSGNK